MIRIYRIILLLVLFISIVYTSIFPMTYFSINCVLPFTNVPIYFAYYFIYSLLIAILRNSRFFYYKFYYFNFYPVYFIILNEYTYHTQSEGSMYTFFFFEGVQNCVY